MGSGMRSFLTHERVTNHVLYAYSSQIDDVSDEASRYPCCLRHPGTGIIREGLRHFCSQDWEIKHARSILSGLK